MIHSMTGFAVQNREVGAVTLHLELRSVNSRYLDLAFRIADDLRQAEPMLREAASRHFARGKVECRLSWRSARSSLAAASALATTSTVPVTAKSFAALPPLTASWAIPVSI